MNPITRMLMCIQNIELAKATIPNGWTNEISPHAKAQVEDMLAESTNLPNVTVDLVEIKGNQYLFHSGSTFYFWNVVTQSGVRVLNPTDKAELYEQMGTDIREVEGEQLPYVE